MNAEVVTRPESDLEALRSENTRLLRKIDELEHRLALQNAATRIVGVTLRAERGLPPDTRNA